MDALSLTRLTQAGFKAGEGPEERKPHRQHENDCRTGIYLLKTKIKVGVIKNTLALRITFAGPMPVGRCMIITFARPMPVGEKHDHYICSTHAGGGEA
ncbi:hypothetical protein AVEN_201650-1 [Araneus ventricosus]|uniref:Uncharacterized protein n=1 Tax=Araneus ventricosus TaxID=182803 RepID=A0A4Y2NXU3_ARAVE|nr:hypothetical protein AVEN_201650-1 [Araneus ventricosus]